MIIGVFGTGGCGRGIAPLVEGETVFVSDDAGISTCNGRAVLDLPAFAALPNPKAIAIAIADPRTRAAIVARCADHDLAFATIRAPGMVWMDNSLVGEGGLFSSFTTVTSNVRIGQHFHCNLYSYVEHDCVIGDFVTFAPAVRCNGNVTIGDYAYIGSNAVIRQGITIGARAIIGMGAVVVKDVPAGETVVGNPAQRRG